MPIGPLSNVLTYPQGGGEALPDIDIDLSNTGESVSFEDGARKTEMPDGSVVIDLEPKTRKKSDKFNANLAEDLEESELNRISTELLEGIDRDNNSRQEHLDMIAEGMKLLGLVLESVNTSGGQSSAPLEGMSTVRHPLLLEACQLFQANAMGELLPASGPVKVRDDRPQKPVDAPMIGHNGGPPLDNPFVQAPPMAPMPPAVPPGLPVGAPGAGPSPGVGMLPPQMQPPGPMPASAPPMPGGHAAGPMPAPPMAPPVMPPMEPPEEPRDELANALEKDFNHYLTSVAKEYVPDTDQMLFKVGFGGLGIKKVFNCPLRRRPVSQSIDVEDFIVSNALTDLSNAGRITHRIKMRPSVLKRMQILEVYRDVPIGAPMQSDSPNVVDQQKAEIAGVQAQVQDPKDADHVLYECYCELDIDEFAPAKFKGKGLPLPYRVTIEKESQKILEIRRNWKESDEECMAREFFVDFPYMRAFGFYCIGLLHLLGNTTKALTALWREFIDAGMFANFPGFLYLKGAGRQLTNQFRVAPGSGVGLDSSVQDIRQAVMPLPYKSPDAGFVQFVSHVEELGQRLGGTANMNVGEGRQDAPVGTTLALIEQATKPVGAVNKRLHVSQAKEFALLKERFVDDPEAFWRFNKRPAMPWQKEQFLQALNDYDLVPVSDPNNPTRMHRAAKASTLQGMATAAPQLFDLKKVVERVGRELELGDLTELFAPAGPPPVDPKAAAQASDSAAKVQSDKIKADAEIQRTTIQQQGDLAELQARKEIEEIKQETARINLAANLAMHSEKIESNDRIAMMKLASEERKQSRQHYHDVMTAPQPEPEDEE